MKRETDDLIADELIFAGVQAGPDFQTKGANTFADSHRAPNRLFRGIEPCEYSVTGRNYLLSNGQAQFSADRSIILIHYL